ncbi:UNVERIFIED_CONTAM: hypothetical protein PYX00_006071 [Menopon gallinae]|uniref:Chitin-binding type-2 domain-containing protein n=1 Tax=Menopon gallinae TaxID=328185 RepID=A0AAW2HVX8_9NEOP
MHKLLIALFAVAAIGANARPYGDDYAADLCVGKSDGFYPDVFDRAAFYSCFDGTLLGKVVCEDGLEFDGVESCVPIESAAAEEVETEDNKVMPSPPPKPPMLPEPPMPPMGDLRVKKIFNIEITKNIFPKSLIIIGKMNREQKNK